MDDSWSLARELRRMLKVDWAELWKTKHEDEVKAEGVSVQDFESLFVDRGEIIHATRDFKPLSFSEILEKHVGPEKAAGVDVNPRVGGWRKFAKKNFPAKHTKREKPEVKADLSQQQRKGGSGWLNKARIYRKLKFNNRR